MGGERSFQKGRSGYIPELIRTLRTGLLNGMVVARAPAEFKHINKQRKRNQQRFP